jgi:hypothetical protein
MSCKGKISAQRRCLVMPPNEPCPNCGQLIRDWHQTMILTLEEICFMDVYCYEGAEPPFGGPATDAMRSIGIQNGDTLNLQWAYLRDEPPTGPVIGKPSSVAPPLPWASRDAVLRRDAEIRAIREEVQRLRLTPAK